MSTIPDAIDALVATIGRVLPGVQISDGPGVDWLEQDTIVVGWQVDRAAVTVETEQEGIPADDRERYDVACLVSCVSGDTEIKPLRDRTFNYYRTIANELKRDQTLGGKVLRARPSLAQLDQTQLQSGAGVGLAFLVTCTAFAN